jgi:hypothetical protein
MPFLGLYYNRLCWRKAGDGRPAQKTLAPTMEREPNKTVDVVPLFCANSSAARLSTHLALF